MSEMSARRRVYGSDKADSDEGEDAPLLSGNVKEKTSSRRSKRAKTASRIADKIHALLWTVALILTLRFTRFFTVLFTDGRVSQPWLYISLLAVGIDIACLLYLTVYLPFIARIDTSWDIYCPNVIPIATASAVACFLGLLVAIWPVYGFLTPIILLVLFIGSIMATQFVPFCC